MGPGASLQSAFALTGARRLAVRTAAVALGLICAGGAAASSASAITYCVADPGCVAGGGTSEPDLQSALTGAETNLGDDLVQVGPGTFQAAGPNGFQYGAPAGNTVQLVGAGSDQTILTTPNITTSAGIITLDVEMASGGGSTVSDLAVHLPGVTSGTGQSVGIFAKGADMDRVAVTTPPSATAALGVEFQTGTLEDSTVSVPQGLGGAAAVRVNDGQNGTIADSTLSGYYGIYGDASSSLTTITAQRDRIQAIGGNAGIYTRATSLTAEDTLIQTSGTGVHTFTNATLDGTSTLRNLTITGDPGFGIYDEGANSGRTATINLDSSIIDTEFTSIFRDGSGGGTSTVNANNSNYSSSTAGIGAGALNEDSSDKHFADPKFVNSAGQDFQLRFDSPLLDLGNPINSGGATDLGGLSRVVNGRLDMGAFEYQRRRPSAVATATPGTVQTGQAATFDGAGSSDPDPGDTIAYAWTFDDGATANGRVASHAFATAGNHTGKLTVTDPTGLHATATATVMVIAPTPPSVGGPTGERAAALKKCKKKKSTRARRKCKKKAKRLPV
jgi:hypothetical protein